jgi:hypothetical protein
MICIKFLISGDNIRNEVVFQHRDLVFEQQLALFQPRDLQLVMATSQTQGINGSIQITMFQAQRCKPFAHLVFSQPGHSCARLYDAAPNHV